MKSCSHFIYKCLKNYFKTRNMSDFFCSLNSATFKHIFWPVAMGTIFWAMTLNLITPLYFTDLVFVSFRG